jgi:lysophospholipase L1-like esterase
LKGDTSADLLQRSHHIIEAKPRNIVINIGANDAALKVPVDETAANLRELLGLIHSLSPESDVVLQSALPLQPLDMPAIEAINTELQRIAEKRQLHYVDLNAELFHANGTLREGLGLSSRHLLSAGYARWAEVLAPYLLDDNKLASAR